MSASSSEQGISYLLADRASPLAAYPHMREVDGFLFVSGISSRRPDQSVQGVTHHDDGSVTTDIGEQTRGVLENMRAILAAAGAGLEHVVAITAYLVDMGEYAGFNAVYNEHFTAQSGPTRTTVGVASLPGPHLRIEMTAVARAPGSPVRGAVRVPLSASLLPLADRLWEAQQTHTPCVALSETHPQLSVQDAYAIQRHNIERGGQRRVGWKVGLTSVEVQKWLGVDEPDFGVLTADMAVGDGAAASVADLLQARAEGEIAFVLGRDLKGPVTVADVLRATEFVLPSIEIIDSRIADWKIRHVDTVADNASSARFVLGTRPLRLDALDLRLLGMTMRKNGEVAATGAGAACLGNPVNAVVWLVDTLAALGEGLRAGDIVLSGALGPVAPVGAGDDIEVDMGTLGTVSVRFV